MPQAFKEFGYFVTGARGSKCTLSYSCSAALCAFGDCCCFCLFDVHHRLVDLDVLLVDLEIRAGVGKSFHPNKPPNFDRELAPACTALRSQEFLFCLFVCYF